MRFILIVVLGFIGLCAWTPDCRGSSNRVAESVAALPAQVAVAHTMVERIYLDVLRRYPDESGLDFFSNAVIKEGRDAAWVRTALRNSPEGVKLINAERRRRVITGALLLVPALLLVVMFITRKNTKDFVFKCLLLSVSVTLASLFFEGWLRAKARREAKRNAMGLKVMDQAALPPRDSAVSLQHIIHMSSDHRLVYELLPGLQVNFMGGKVKTGADGYRLTPGSAEGSNAFCIVGLGDSVMFGWGVNDDETYLSCLCRKKAQRAGRPIKVVNMSVPGYNTVMEVEALKTKGLTFRPDLVIIHFVENDLDLPNFICRTNTETRLTKSYLLSALSSVTGGNLATEHFSSLVRASGDIPEGYEDMVGEPAYRRAMKELAAMSRERGFKVVVLVNWGIPPFVREITQEEGMPVIEMGSTMTDYCRAHGIRDYLGSVLTVGKNDPHYSALGHQLVTDTVLSFLEKHKLLPE